MEHNQSNGGQNSIPVMYNKSWKEKSLVPWSNPQYPPLRYTFLNAGKLKSFAIVCLGVFTVYLLIPKAKKMLFFSHNLPFLEFSTAFLTFTHCFHAEYVSASFWESVDRGGAIGSGPLFWETMLISPLVHRHWGEKTVERTRCGVCGGSRDPVDLHHAFKVFLYTPHQIPTTVKYRLSTFYCCLTCCLG